MSLRRGLCILLNGLTKQIDPTTTVETNRPAPNKAPIARPTSPSFIFSIAVNALNKSGDPLPFKQF
jgi:hypothetical protein